jgi:hypothetical protein
MPRAAASWRACLGCGAQRGLPAVVLPPGGDAVRRVPQRGGEKKAIIAVAHKLLVIVWHVLATGRTYQDLGGDYFTTRLDPAIETRRLVAKLEALGHTVALNPAA